MRCFSRVDTFCVNKLIYSCPRWKKAQRRYYALSIASFKRLRNR